MKVENKEDTNRQIHRPRLVKRDYYFHADEDFREDREWGKTNPDDLNATTTSESARSLSA